MKFLLLIILVFIAVKGFSQPDTAVINFPQYREVAYKKLVGGHLQNGTDSSGKEHFRKYFEIGFHRTITMAAGHHPEVALTHGFSVEMSPIRQPILGFKYGTWVEFWMLVLGLNGIYYTDFNHGNFKIRPEFGIGTHSFKLAFGYNIPTIFNSDFEELRRADLQLSLNILLKLKTVKREDFK